MRDHLGNNRIVADLDGNVIQNTKYYPFGLPMDNSTGKEVQPYKYNGKEYETIAGINLYDYHARQHDPILGRFTSIDPLAEKYYSWSPYVYVKNNPTRLIDPTGLYDIDAIEKDKQYGVVAVYATGAEKDKDLAIDIDAAKQAGIPVIYVDNVADYSDAMKAIGDIGASTKTYTLNSHGAYDSRDGTQGFKIGSDYVNENTNVASLKSGLEGKNVFVGACSVTSSSAGIRTIENLSTQTNSTVIASDQTVPAGYNYAGNGLNASFFSGGIGVRGVIGNTFLGENHGNSFHVVKSGQLTQQVYNVSVLKSGSVNWNSGNKPNYPVMRSIR